jgi:RND superfamily putative drug exporter
MLERLARFSFRRKWLMVFAIWVPLLVIVNGISSGVGTDYHTDFKLPDSQSKDAFDILERAGLSSLGGDVAQIVFHADQGIDDPAVHAAMQPLFDEVGALPKVTVTSPYTPEGARFVSQDHKTAFAQMSFDVAGQKEYTDLAKNVKDLGKGIHVDGLRIEYGGNLFGTFEFPPSEALGLLAAILILLLAFGSVLAMGLPIGTALFGLGVGSGLVGLASHVGSTPEFAPQMAAMIGLGVGIDYALFIVSRYRENLHEGMTPEDATVDAVDSSGRAVLFAGLTVMISLLGLFIIGLSFVRGLAVASSIAVLVMVAAALSLVPALLGFVGHRIGTTSRAAGIAVGGFVVLSVAAIGLHHVGPFLAGLALAVLVMVASFLPFGHVLRKPLPHRHEKPRQERFWYRWSRFIQHRPWVALLGSVAVLVTLALPLFSLRLGFGDTGNLPKDTTARKAYDIIADGFGKGFNGPLMLVSDDPDVTADTAGTVDAVLASTPNVAFHSSVQEPKPGIHIWQVFPQDGPQDESTSTLVRDLRRALPGTGLDVKVAGITAASIDFATYLGTRLVYLIGGVLVLSFLLLMIVFRSVLVPLKAVIMNLLSVGASYGIVVAVFQWGWGKGLIGVGKAGPVEAWAPMMLFAITFGLSMDYEVFLLSRIKEEYDRTRDNATAVADGLAVTARVITAAALIMVCVFFAFVLGIDRSLKLFGLGLAMAVLVDATIVRMILVPATLELLGDRNWWLPRWLGRVLPQVQVESAHHHPTVVEEVELEREPVSTP